MLKNILVALDGSEIGERVIQSLDNLALSKDANVILCHVFPTPESEMELPADRPQPESPTFSYGKWDTSRIPDVVVIPLSQWRELRNREAVLNSTNHLLC